MKSTHNPDQLISDLREVIAQGRKRIGLLIGAGAPISIQVENETGEKQCLIPGVEELTELTVANLEDGHQVAVDSIRKAHDGNANIEDILSKLRLLEKAIGEASFGEYDGAGYGQIARALCEKIGELVGVELPEGDTPYRDLVNWIEGTARPHGVEIFTTNYDLLFEEALERASSPYFDGFTGGARSFFDPVTVVNDDLPARWTRLWKIHGSLGWKLTGERVTRGHGKEASELVYPDHLKYDQTQRQPYAALFGRLKQFLTEPDTVLLAAGFSFRDPHITSVLRESLSANANSAVFAFQYGTIANEVAAARIGNSHPNFSVYASDGGIVGGVQGDWQVDDDAKQWAAIRPMYWHEGKLTLGDFRAFARFLALTKASRLSARKVDREEVEALEDIDASE